MLKGMKTAWDSSRQSWDFIKVLKKSSASQKIWKL